KEPGFEYRPLPDIDSIQERLDRISPQDAEDPSFATMVDLLVHELNLRLEMFRNRGTDKFFLVSVEMFGHVDEATLDLANRILTAESASQGKEQTMTATEFAARARRELDHYRRDYPEMKASVKVSRSRPGVMVETGVLHIGHDTRVAHSRADQLLQHEVGTHIVTFENGNVQPLQMLALGLAGYDELQEALGVLAEHLSGGIRLSRLRVLAYRVVAAHLLSEGAEFRETFDRLTELGCGRRTAFTTTMRAYRSGGMTKDAIYLRGLVRLLSHLAGGGQLGPLFVGKISFESIPLIAQLRERQVLLDPPLSPRFLSYHDADARLSEIAAGRDLLEIAGVAA
ncbi:MAG: flavohemoglobin expression-modulating QEGLA motif protein, partial [Actinobacteria bacterium]|nr:flavohemoglobin expression-modulating QEGLA motif protein [Actinomycetota bacterium]